ncbi:hypothetical protein [Bradyrhizobium sp. UNPA324]|uniref:lipopolysaccharide biosynthesis protein n=1 Tax=Bradyrhizobium sp. UNPA324 TaxID=1141174 RepID=UPI00114EE5EF|nr:hypothetical protein [Bradyrhizobium sp. UNPA324]TQF33459.1 hypothetical protein UNPA324_30865 [Bradyrhizobium sp. UNPA324]
MTIRRRIVSGTAVNAAALVLSATVQLLSVPVLISNWGVDKYGIWLMLITIPTYFALSDFGFASAATSDMTIHAAKGQRGFVRATFQSVWLLLNAISLGLVGLVAVVAQASSNWRALAWWTNQYGGILVGLVLFCALIMNTRLILGALRATQNYALGTAIHETLAILETCGVLLSAWAGYGFEEAVEVMIALRLLNLGMLYLVLRYNVPWLRLGVAHASITHVKRLLAPSLAAMAVPLALALNVQGMVVVTGLAISASAAATFASVRTVSRVAIQVVGAINRASMPEFSAAGARDNRKSLAKIVGLNLASVVVVLIPGAVLFTLFGSRAVEIWTNNKVHPEPIFVLLIAISMIAHALWYYTSNLLLASNTHGRVAPVLVTVSILSVLAAFPAGATFGLYGIGLALALAEIICLLGVLRAAVNLDLLRMEDLDHALRVRVWRQ